MVHPTMQLSWLTKYIYTFFQIIIMVMLLNIVEVEIFC